MVVTRLSATPLKIARIQATNRIVPSGYGRSSRLNGRPECEAPAWVVRPGHEPSRAHVRSMYSVCKVRSMRGEELVGIGHR